MWTYVKRESFILQANKRSNKKQRGKAGKQAVVLRPNRADVISRLALSRVEDYRNADANPDDVDGTASWGNRSEQIFSDIFSLLM